MYYNWEDIDNIHAVSKLQATGIYLFFIDLKTLCQSPETILGKETQKH